MSPYDFKDGLIYVDKETNDGDFYDSKLLWALGNYSRFIRPGAKRVSVAYDNYNTEENLKDGVLLSAYKNTDDSLVLVAINQSDAVTDIKLNVPLPPNTKIERYVTSESHNLSKIPNGQFGKGKIQVLGKSLTTFIFNVGE